MQYVTRCSIIFYRTPLEHRLRRISSVLTVHILQNSAPRMGAFFKKATVLARCLKGEGLKKDLKGHERDLKEGLKKGLKDRGELVNKILAIISDTPTATYIDLSRECNTSLKLVRTILRELKEAHVITRVGPKRGGTWQIIH
jgi:predicted transcriptional regulator